MNKNKVKGDNAERAVVKYLQANGYIGAERTRAGYHTDWSDIVASPGLSFQVKDTKAYMWNEWVKQAEQQRKNSGMDFNPIVKKLRGKADAGQWLVTMTLKDFTKLTRLAGYGSAVDE